MTKIEQYLEKTRQATEAVSRFQDVLRKARMMRNKAEQEVEHRYQEELEV